MAKKKPQVNVDMDLPEPLRGALGPLFRELPLARQRIVIMGLGPNATPNNKIQAQRIMGHLKAIYEERNSKKTDVENTAVRDTAARQRRKQDSPEGKLELTEKGREEVSKKRNEAIARRFERGRPEFQGSVGEVQSDGPQKIRARRLIANPVESFDSNVITSSSDPLHEALVGQLSEDTRMKAPTPASSPKGTPALEAVDEAVEAAAPVARKVAPKGKAALGLALAAIAAGATGAAIAKGRKEKRASIEYGRESQVSISEMLKRQREAQAAQINEQRLQMLDPHLYTELMAGRKLAPEDVFLGEQRRDLVDEVVNSMSQPMNELNGY